MVDDVSSRVEVFDEAQNVTRYHCSTPDEKRFVFEVNYERGAWWLSTGTSDYTGWISNLSYVEHDGGYRCAVHEAAMRVDKITYAFNFVLYFDRPVYVLDAVGF